METRNDFIAEMKNTVAEETHEASTYLSLTVKNRKGIKVGDTYIFIDRDASNASIVRIFAPAKVAVKRVDENGTVATKYHKDKDKA